MTAEPRTLIAVDPEALAALHAEVAALRRAVEAVTMQPKPEWVTIDEYAKMIGRSRKTVLRRIAEGRVEVKHVGGVRMIRVAD